MLGVSTAEGGRVVQALSVTYFLALFLCPLLLRVSCLSSGYRAGLIGQSE